MIEASGLKMIPVEDFNSAAKTVSCLFLNLFADLN